MEFDVVTEIDTKEKHLIGRKLLGKMNMLPLIEAIEHGIISEQYDVHDGVHISMH